MATTTRHSVVGVAATIPEELESMGLLFFARLDETAPDHQAKLDEVTERISTIAKAIQPIGVELATKTVGTVLTIAVFPQTSFRRYADATKGARDGN